jgi:tetratricopeptide (TPR) repeat protein
MRLGAVEEGFGVARVQGDGLVEARNAEAFLHRAQAHLASGNYPKARADATKALALRANESAALLVRSEAAAWQEDREAALADAERILTLSPNHPGALALRALCLDSRQVDQIIKDANAACDAAPEGWLGHMARARGLMETAKYPEAQMAAEKARRLAPRSCEPLCTLSIIATSLGNHDDALSLARRALAMNSNSIGPLFALGTYYIKREDADMMLQYGEEALRINPNSVSARLLRGAGLVSKSDFKGALVELNYAIRLDSGLGIIYAFRSFCHLQLDEADAALNNAEEAIRLAPEQYLGFLVRASARLHKDDRAGALTDLREASRLNPESDQVRGLVKQLAAAPTAPPLPVSARFQIGRVQGRPTIYFSAQNNLPRAIENCTVVASCDSCDERRVFLSDGVFPTGQTLTIGELQNWEWDDGAKLVISAKGYQTREWVFDSENLQSP